MDKKTCFVVTPIGSDGSEIRRHIDGIIDQSIIPALCDKFDIKVAHREYETGSINDRVIKSIYESDLVIANLTNLNPNVMFELAIRYSFAKPVIVIAEKGTTLPFDIVEQNTIFYINDPSGANELKKLIAKFEENIEYDSNKYGPIYKIIQHIPLYEAVESGSAISNNELTKYVIDRLDYLEKTLINKNKMDHMVYPTMSVRYEFNANDHNVVGHIEKEIRERLSEFPTKVYDYEVNPAGLKLAISSRTTRRQIDELEDVMSNILTKNGVESWVKSIM